MPKLPLPKLISIDLDGTLLDSVPDLAWAADKTMEAMAYPRRGVDKVRNWVGNGVPMLLRRALGDGDENAVTDPVTLQQARQHFDEFYSQHFATDSQVYEGVFDTLRWFQQHDIQLALITNKPIGFTVPMMQALELAPFFRWTLGGDSLKKAKPDPLPLLTVAADMNLQTDQCLHIGDSSTDVKAAQNAGFTAVAVSFGYNHGQPIADSKPDRAVDHWAEIPSLFNLQVIDFRPSGMSSHEGQLCRTAWPRIRIEVLDSHRGNHQTCDAPFELKAPTPRDTVAAHKNRGTRFASRQPSNARCDLRA